VWSLARPQPKMHVALAGTPFESLTALREIEGVARPTATLKTERFVGSATAPTTPPVLSSYTSALLAKKLVCKVLQEPSSFHIQVVLHRV